MKVRFKIISAFMLVTLVVLAAVCIFIYYFTASQQKTDFTKRLYNRALTVASLIFKLPPDDYDLLSKLDSSTTSLRVAETINIYNNRNSRIYRFAKNYQDTVAIGTELLNKVRSQNFISTTLDNKQLVAIYYMEGPFPIVVVISAIDENGHDNLAELQKSLLLAFLAGSVLSFLTGWLFSRRLLKPIENIAQAVNNISATNIQNRLPESGVKDEWNLLAVTFNNLLERLQESFEIQGRFISNASHELSTPLTSVINQIDVTLRKERSNEEYLAVLESVQADTRHMSSLTQQLLNIARTARGGAIQTESVRIDEIIMELPFLMKKISPEYQVQTYFDELPEDENFCTVNGNYDLLLSAFRNLSENGCKYASNHLIKISLSFIGKNIVVLFSNTYAAFDPAELESIFQPFQRGSNASNEKGYGLGLSLTRRILLLHKGEIKAEIAEPGNILITVILPSAG
ncbi:MAG: HAMP domain-containing protein [Bacteroidota bacterium]|nr:HAMP domain-containing protein [Bacteroidota bacterium]